MSGLSMAARVIATMDLTDGYSDDGASTLAGEPRSADIDLTFCDSDASIIREELDVQDYEASEDDENNNNYVIISDSEDVDNDDIVEVEGLALNEGNPTIPEAFPEEVELERIETNCGTVSKGETVEIKDDSGRQSACPISGDFLRIVVILEILRDEKVVLRGYRLRRCSYMRPLFDNRANELFVLAQTNGDDKRPALVQGLVDIPIEAIIRKRECVFTNKAFWSHSFREYGHILPPGLTPREKARHVFDHGRLVCRFVYTNIRATNGKSYSGSVRRIYKHECNNLVSPTIPRHSSTPQRHSIPYRPVSVELLQTTPQKPQARYALRQYTMADVYCGAGGVSAGAEMAGLLVKWGLDLDEKAMTAYEMNFPGALPYLKNAHDLPAMATRMEHGVDVLHLSCPCCYWSEVHVHDGQNDQANAETLLTVGPILRAIKPRIATLEQAPGLLKTRKHRLWFRKLINDIICEGYNIRWEVRDLSEFELPQRRRRLIFICARQGVPLPAFPKSVCGASGSGLKRWVSVGDALEPLQRQVQRNDPYHQPHLQKRLRRIRVDPYAILAKCITTDGGANTHPSGERAYTPREFSQLQGFPLSFRFFGSCTEATKQIGNAWAPITSAKYFLLIAQTLEAFDMGLVDAEEDVEDLWDILNSKGVWGRSFRSQYLRSLKKTIVPQKKHKLWGRDNRVTPGPRTRQRHHSVPSDEDVIMLD